jgi:hypothetical protein
MSNRDLLKEAIADAKTIKETAIANAKVALEEAFAPQLRSMLSAKLEEMEKEDMEEGYDEKMDEAQIEEAKEEEVTEAKEEIDEAEDMDEELDLDEILAELEEGEDKEDVKEAEEMDETIDEAEEDEVEVDAEEEIEGEDEDEEIDLEEMSEEDLKSFIEDVIADMVESGELEAGEEFEAEGEEAEGEEEIDIEDETEEIMEGEKEEVDEIVNEEKEDMDEGMMDKLKAIYNDPEVLGKLITVDGKKMSLKDFLAMAGGATAGSMAGGQASSVKTPGSGVAEGEDEDMMEEVNALRAELHEVNLLNAKLLYSNKIFRAKNLKESQKVKVLEAFDKAENVSEVKLVFETLTEEVAETKTVVKENLGRASKAVGVIAENKAPIVDVNPQVARWQRLAGIK